jgi:hypothetical protein
LPPRSSSDPLSIADAALLSALEGWPAESDSGAGSAPEFWACFASPWRERLVEGWTALPHAGAGPARERLRQEHAAEARPDLSRIHPSWWIRALKEETPAVQRAVVAEAPRAIHDSLRVGLGLTPDDLVPGRSPHAGALGCALILWSERLVGDCPVRDHDPPVIAALCRYDLRDVSRLLQAIALVKWALTGEEPPPLRPRDRARLDFFRARLGEPNPRIKQLARHDVARHAVASRHEWTRLGLLTIARLLDAAEPYRVRWALQHLPYPIAKFTRTLMNPRARADSSLVAWESVVLRTALDRLVSEGRLRDEGGASA